jgi:hypothetical protein
MSILVSVAAASALAAGAVAAPAAQVAAAPSDTYAVCLPSSCLLPASAAVRGVVNWDANVNNFRANNASYPLVYATFTHYTGGVATSRFVFQVPQGSARVGTDVFSSATDSIGVALCTTLYPTPSCATAVVTR